MTPSFSSSSQNKGNSSRKIRGLVSKNDTSPLSSNPLYDHTLYNHLEGNFHLSNKKALFYNMKTLCEWKGEDVFDYLPHTFHIKDGVMDKEFTRFEKYFRELQQTLTNDESSDAKVNNTWIVKPGENTNRGSGVQYCVEFSQIKEIVSKCVYLPNGKTRSYIIQKYLDKPFLYNKRKFDIRCYILVTAIHGNLQSYWCKDGYMRTASKEFSLKNLSRYVHLTNDAVQKHCDDYSKYENGNKLSYLDFQRYLNK